MVSRLAEHFKLKVKMNVVRQKSVEVEKTEQLIKRFYEDDKNVWQFSGCKDYRKIVVNIVNRSRPWLTSSLLKKQARHQCDACT